MNKKISIILFIVFISGTYQSNAQCNISTSSQASAIKSKIVTSSNSGLSDEILTNIQSVFSYLNKQYNSSVKYFFINERNAYFNPIDKNIYVGVPIMKELYNGGGAGAIAYVLAHEFGHFGQDLFPNNNRNVNGTHRVNELQADIIGVYILGGMIDKKIIPYNDKNDVMHVLAQIFKLGDTYFNDKDHHGTHVERTITAFFAPGSILGDNYNRTLKELFSITNNWYTNTGIAACYLNSLNKKSPVGTFGSIYNKNTGEYSTIGLDFCLYPIAIKANGQTKMASDCKAIGKIEAGNSEIINSNDPAGIGFYINILPAVNSYERKFFVYKNFVYTNSSMTTKISYLTWNTDFPNYTSF